MNNILRNGVIVLAISALATTGVLAKNEGKGGGAAKRPDTSHQKKSFEKSTKMDRDETKMKKRERDEDGYDNDASGLAKQRDKKAMQEKKELGRGSEKGQEMREEHSQKWWKFWE